MVQANPGTSNTRDVAIMESNQAVEAVQDVAKDAAADMAAEGLTTAATGLANNEEAQGIAKDAASSMVSGGLTSIGDASAEGCVKGFFSCLSKKSAAKKKKK